MAVPILIPLARIALPILFGTFIGYALRDNEAEEEARKQAKTPVSEKQLRKQLKQKGSRALYKWDDATLKKLGYGGYLAYAYKALWAIGRSGTRLEDNYAASVALRLASIHTQRRTSKDKLLAVWMKDRGFHNENTLARLLAEYKEVKALGVDPRYIGFALGEDYKNLSFAGLTKELVDRA